MADNRAKTVLVLGATGHQGGAVARQLLNKGFKVRAVTRKPESVAAKALSALGVEMIQADMGEEAAMSGALKGAWGAFSVFTMAEKGVQWEEEQGIKFAAAAKNAGVEHFVYSSVSAADRHTGIPHFESKRRIEQKVAGLGFKFYTIIRPVSFMENILNPRTWPGIEAGRLVMGIRPDAKQQLIAVEDIGKFGALPFVEPEKTNKQAIEIAGDELNVNEMAMALEKMLGKEIKVIPVAMDEVRKAMPDFAKMIEWIDSNGYNVDIDGLVNKYGIRPVTFKQFLAKLKLPSGAR